MNKQAIKEAFATHLGAQTLYVTSDEQMFMQRNDAENHQLHIGQGQVVVVERDAAELEDAPEAPEFQEPKGPEEPAKPEAPEFQEPKGPEEPTKPEAQKAKATGTKTTSKKSKS